MENVDGWGLVIFFFFRRNYPIHYCDNCMTWVYPIKRKTNRI